MSRKVERMILGDFIHRGFRNAAKDLRGSDLIEFALMGGFVAVAAEAIIPSIAMSAGSIFSMVASALQDATVGQSIGQ